MQLVNGGSRLIRRAGGHRGEVGQLAANGLGLFAQLRQQFGISLRRLNTLLQAIANRSILRGTQIGVGLGEVSFHDGHRDLRFSHFMKNP